MKVMMQSRALILLLLFFPAIALAQTGMMPVGVPGAPLKLMESTHGIDDWLLGAKLKNVSDKKVTAYRVGWAYVLNDTPDFHEGQWMNLPAGIKPGETTETPAQNVEPNHSARSMLFFIGEVRFADGSHWKADTGAVARNFRTGQTKGKNPVR
jgi:hypothetical protein